MRPAPRLAVWLSAAAMLLAPAALAGQPPSLDQALSLLGPDYAAAAGRTDIVFTRNLPYGVFGTYRPDFGVLLLFPIEDGCILASALAHELTHARRLPRGGWTEAPPPEMDRPELRMERAEHADAYADAALREEAVAHVVQIETAARLGCADRLPPGLAETVRPVLAAGPGEPRLRAWTESSPTASGYRDGFRRRFAELRGGDR